MLDILFTSVFILLMVLGGVYLIASIKRTDINSYIDDGTVNTFRSLDFFIGELIMIAHERANAETISDAAVRMFAIKKCDERLIFTSKAMQSQFPEVSGL